jgi:hypothetical protein
VHLTICPPKNQMITANHATPHGRQQPGTAIRDSISYGVGMRNCGRKR